MELQGSFEDGSDFVIYLNEYRLRLSRRQKHFKCSWTCLFFFKYSEVI